MLDENVAARLDAETLARLDALAERLSTPWLKVSRSAAIRAALLAGLDALEGDAPPSAAAAPRRS